MDNLFLLPRGASFANMGGGFLASLRPDDAWGFGDLTQKDTRYITHGYHRYPAKYIPQLARRLIEENSKKGDFVIDPFGGCGTTAIEAKMHGRRALAVDINPVAVMISNAKIRVIRPDLLASAIARFWERHDTTPDGGAPDNDRINHWFHPPERDALARILSAVQAEGNSDYRRFLQCAFSNILKNCSMWSMKSNKPLYQSDKTPADPIAQFRRQLRTMTRMNEEYHTALQEAGTENVPCKTKRGNAQEIPADDGEADLVVTSPPYVTSYEYADLHQLSALWFGLMTDLPQFRKGFIGSSYAQRNGDKMGSETAHQIARDLREQNASLGEKAAVYFADMCKVFAEVRRVLRRGGRACIVIGDTELRGVKIENTRVFIEQLHGLGFAIADVFARRIISKCIPSTRDAKTGKFSSVRKSDKTAYPVEYIVVAERG